MFNKKFDYLVIHCSDSDFGDVDLIKKWHIDGNGWKDIGYNAVILNGKPKKSTEYYKEKDGMIEIGRGLNLNDTIEPFEVGAHVKGFNSRSLGICLIGKKFFSEKQFETLLDLCRTFLKINPAIKIVGHYELDNKKTCPNIDMVFFRKRLSIND